MRDLISKAVLLLAAATFVACSAERDRLDAEAKRLCALHGGITVYETVILPPDKFNELGQALIPIGRDDTGWGYYSTLNEELLYGSGDSAKLSKLVAAIVRTSDKKTIAVSVMYVRSGGEPLAGYIQHQAVICPPIGNTRLAESVFKQGTSK